MKVTTGEATVLKGQGRFAEPVQLPEHGKDSVIEPNVEDLPSVRVISPRLVDPARAGDLVKAVREEPHHADL